MKILAGILTVIVLFLSGWLILRDDNDVKTIDISAIRAEKVKTLIGDITIKEDYHQMENVLDFLGQEYDSVTVINSSSVMLYLGKKSSETYVAKDTLSVSPTQRVASIQISEGKMTVTMVKSSGSVGGFIFLFLFIGACIFGVACLVYI